MKEQNLKNHSKWILGYHLVSFLAIVLLMVGSIRNVIINPQENMYPGLLLVLISFILLFLFYFMRAFSLKAQDRAIKVEENFRHYILTGKQLPSNLRIRQIIGLRFASDAEFPELVVKAVNEKLSEKDIKKAIKEWKPDYYRV